MERGTLPTERFCLIINEAGSVAQWLEHLPLKQGVESSNLSRPTSTVAVAQR